MKNKTPLNVCHPGEGRDLFNLKRAIKWIPAFAGMTLLFFLVPLTAIAEESTETIQQEILPSPLPEFCEFTIQFPEEPEIGQICNRKGDECFEQIKFTRNFDGPAAVNFRVSCQAVPDALQSYYTEEVMLQNLDTMTKRSVVSSYKTSYREEEDYRQAGLVGEGQLGRSSMIYIAQLWIGKNSAFALEAELIGEQHLDAETLFADVLRSVQSK